MAKDIWKKYDRDGNGFLDEDEIRNFVADVLNNVDLEQSFPIEKKESNLDVKEIFSQIDLNGNGKVEFEEMADFLLRISGFTFVFHWK